MKKRVILGILSGTLFFFSACGSSTGESSDTQNLPVYAALPASTNDEPYFYKQWYLEKNNTFYSNNGIDVDAHIHPATYLNSFSGKGVKIAIIDDGLDVEHPDLYRAVVGSYDLASKTTDVAHSSISGYHGTAVTGIIGARSNSIGIRGIASRAWLYFLKYKDPMSDSETIELFNKAEAFGADIINCSWGTYNVSDAVKDKIVELSKNGRQGKGTLIVFAVGNHNRDLDTQNDESAIAEVIAVGATNKNNERSWYSNYGSQLDVMAPGGETLALPTLDDRGVYGENAGDYIFENGNFFGTSAAAPVVTGILALLLEKYPNLTHDEVVELLKSKSDKIGTEFYDANGWNKYYGYGKINISKLFQ